MRQLWTLLALTMLGTTEAWTQARWRPEIGIQGGIARIKPTGTGVSDQIDVWDLPGDGSSYVSLFAIIPATSRLAIEPSLSASQFSFGEAGGLAAFVSGTNVSLTVRGNVAVAAGLYAAAGGTLGYAESGGLHDTQVGLVAALGYHLRLRPGLTARVEAQAISMRGADTLVPFNVYALLVGISAGTGRPASPSALVTERAHMRPWRLALGMAGGYARNHVHGRAFGLSITVDETLLALPGSGGTTPPTLYLVVPLRGRFALETGIDAHRRQANGTTLFDGHAAVRLDVALSRGWYAAAGGNVLYIQQSGTAAFAFAGANVAAGYRFPLIGELDGRMELNYTAFKERQNVPLAQNILGLMFGVTMPLK